MPGSSKNKDSPPEDIVEHLGDRYANYKYLSKGGMGTVFTADDTKLVRKVVIKVLRNDFEDDEAFVRFQREARLTSKLQHENIIHIYDFGITKRNHPFLIMDHIEGESLAQILKREERLPVELAVEIVLQMASGIAHAHFAGVLHRDLKLSNVMISGYDSDSDMKATVIDFGLAIVEDQSDSIGRLTRTGIIQGSPLYMSPEQADGEAGDERSDVYSTGCVLHKLLTGVVPIHAESVLRLIALKQKRPPSISEAFPDLDLPPQVVRIVDRCLEPDPDMRFQTIKALIEALEQSEEISSSSEPALTDEKKPGRDQSTKVLFAILGLILIAVIAYTTISAKQPAPDRNSAALSPAENLPKFHVAKSEEVSSSQKCIKAKPDIQDEDLQEVAELLGRYTKLELTGTKIRGDGLRYLSSLPITDLNLRASAVENDTLRYLTKIETLKSVNLSETSISDQGLAILSDSKLSSLKLSNCKRITDNGIRDLQSLKLERLFLENTNVTDRGLAYLGNIKTLKGLRIDKTSITDAGLRHLSGLPINSIRFTDCPVTGKSLQIAARSWPQLLSIAFGNSNTIPRITARDFRQLFNLKHVEYIESWFVPITDSELKLIASQFPKIKWLYIRGGKFTESGLEHIYKLHSLRVLGLWHNGNLPGSAMLKLKRQLPATCTFLTEDDRTMLPEGLSDMYKQSTSVESGL